MLSSVPRRCKGKARPETSRSNWCTETVSFSSRRLFLDSSPSPYTQHRTGNMSLSKSTNVKQLAANTTSSSYYSPLKSPHEYLSPSLYYDVEAVGDRQRISSVEEWARSELLRYDCEPIMSTSPVSRMSPSALYDEYNTRWDEGRILANADLSGYSRG